MTETQKTLNMIEEAEFVVNGLLDLSKEDISKGLDDYISLKSKIEFLMRKTRKYRKFLSIKDSSRQIYGPKMLDKMRNMCQRFEVIDQIFEEQLNPIFESVEMEYRIKLMNLEAEERRKKEEELKKRIEEGVQETYLEEKARLKRLKERVDEELRRENELDRLTQEEIRNQNKINEIVRGLVVYISNLESEYGELLNIDELEHVLSNYIKNGIIGLLFECEMPGDFYSNLEKISDLIGCILRDPSDIKFRLIRLSNDSFFQSFGEKKSSILIFFGIGFRIITNEERKEYYEILSSKDSNINISRLNTSDSYITLREPDPIDQYESWVFWMNRLHLINNIIKEVIKLKYDKNLSKELTSKLVENIVIEFKNNLKERICCENKEKSNV
ncbi:hypothetical protein FG386_000976 [Cryptosporidium ryanae]|uniref:uncharacterized protein n=1 Tax=Cryptosporidium ryanae TaxID=515981 RepID=UPI00351A461E|nr:hypothetical protein FG386_000976 [Cryptosporidium ryanae]